MGGSKVLGTTNKLKTAALTANYGKLENMSYPLTTLVLVAWCMGKSKQSTVQCINKLVEETRVLSMLL